MSRPRLWLSRPLVVAQVALSLLLLTGAGLFVKTLRNLRAVDLGFAADDIVQARIDPQGSGYKREQLPQLYSTLLERIRSAPGVQSASLAATGFRSGMSRTCCIAVEGRTASPEENREVQTVSATPGYFQTMGMSLQAGREFTWQEIPGKSGQFAKVAVINKTLAQYYFGDTNPVGHRFGWGDPSKEQVKYDMEIVGVVNDAKYGNLRDQTKPLTRLFMASTLLSPQQALDRTRAHWQIENGLHWMLDVHLNEDLSRARKDNAPANTALINRLARNILQLTDIDKVPISHRIKKCAWNDDYLINALTHMR